MKTYAKRIIFSYFMLLLVTYFLWVTPIFILTGFINLKLIELLLILRTAFAIISIATTIALPFLIFRSWLHVIMAAIILLGTIINFGRVYSDNSQIEAKVARVMSGDIVGGPFHISKKRITYYSSYVGDKCGDVCLKFLFEGKVESFTARKLVAPNSWYREGNIPEKRQPLTPSSGRTYRLEKRISCPDPLKSAGNDYYRLTSKRAYAREGTCFLGAPAEPNDGNDLHILFERNPTGSGIPKSKYWKVFLRLWVLKPMADGKIQFTSANVLSRQTKLMYLAKTLKALYGPAFLKVRAGDWEEGKTDVSEYNATTAALGLLSPFFPNEMTHATKWVLTPPPKL